MENFRKDHPHWYRSRSQGVNPYEKYEQLMPLYRQWLEFRGKYDKLEKILKEAEEAAFASNPHRYANPGHDEFKEKWMENFQKDHPHWYRSQPTASGQGLVKGAILCFTNPYFYF